MNKARSRITHPDRCLLDFVPFQLDTVPFILLIIIINLVVIANFYLHFFSSVEIYSSFTEMTFIKYHRPPPNPWHPMIVYHHYSF